MAQQDYLIITFYYIDIISSGNFLGFQKENVQACRFIFEPLSNQCWGFAISDYKTNIRIEQCDKTFVYYSTNWKNISF